MHLGSALTSVTEPMMSPLQRRHPATNLSLLILPDGGFSFSLTVSFFAVTFHATVFSLTPLFSRSTAATVDAEG